MANAICTRVQLYCNKLILVVLPISEQLPLKQERKEWYLTYSRQGEAPPHCLDFSQALLR